MADGKFHDRAILATAPIVGLAAMLIAPSLTPIAVASHVLGGLFLSPDLDTVSRPYRRWGVLRWIWIPYQKLIPHRGLSHLPIVGTASRVAYLLLPVLVGLECSAIVHLWADGLLK